MLSSVLGPPAPQRLPHGVSQVGLNPSHWETPLEVGLALHKGAGCGTRVSSQQLLKTLGGLEAPEVTEAMRVLWALKGLSPGVLPFCTTTEGIDALRGSPLHKVS